MIFLILLSVNNTIALNWLDYLSIIGTVFSIIGVGITIYLAHTTQNIKDKVKIISNIKTFQKDKKTLLNELKSCKDIIVIDVSQGLQDLTRITRLLEEYTSFMSKSDLKILRKLKRMIKDNKKVNNEELLTCINHIIGFLELNIDISYKNI